MTTEELTLNKEEEQILEALYDVKDPEIPTVSLVDLGLITHIEVRDDGSAYIRMIPTFSGCPALTHMQDEVKERVEKMGYEQVEVEIDHSVSWSTNRVTEQGLRDIEKIGLSTPKKFCGQLNLDNPPPVTCPKCKSEKTAQISPFGPTLCRAVYYCNECEETFEQFKPV